MSLASEKEGKTYLTEIDGLRAIAILLVVFFHAGLLKLNGGFVGVDVFFVISGFLMTRIIIRELDSGHFSLPEFWKRRIFRIAPALFVVIAIAAMVFLVLLPPALATETLHSFLSAIGSVSNLWFYESVNYFEDSGRNPALHTWSLGVEEQFYVALPLLMLLMARFRFGRRTIACVFSCLFVASLIAAEWTVRREPAAAFYLPWLRAWELLAGSLIAIVPIGAAPIMADAMLFLGLIAIAWAASVYDKMTSFPGLSAMLPVVGAVLVIAASGQGRLGMYILANRPMRWIGKVSYSFYLVHWPLICLANLTVSMAPIPVRLAVFAVSLGVAWLSWRFVETPMRLAAARFTNTRSIQGFFSGSILLSALIFCFSYGGKLVWEDHPEALKLAQSAQTDVSFFRPGKCFITPETPDFSKFDKEECLRVDGGKNNVLLIGDSHAANLWYAMRELNPGVNILQATASGCTPILQPNGSPWCVRLRDFILNEWLPQHASSISSVVIAAQWQQQDMIPLLDTIAKIRNTGVGLSVVGPVPEYFASVPLALAYGNVTGLDLTRLLEKSERRSLDALMAREVAEKANYISLIEHMCVRGGCIAIADGRPLYFDKDHLTLEGSRMVAAWLALPG